MRAQGRRTGGMGRYLRKCAAVAAVLCLAGFVWGCGRERAPETPQEGQYYTYFVNPSGTGLISQIYEPKAGPVEAIIEELLLQCQTVPEGREGRRAIPSNVALSGPVRLEDGIASIYFDTTYTTRDKVTELLCKAALAKTLTQLEEVEYISIYVNDRPYTGNNVVAPAGDGENTAPGENTGGTETAGIAGAVNTEPVLLSGADFIDNTGDATNQYTQAELNLYFANEEGTALVEEERAVVYSSSLSLERVVLNQLVEGPYTEGNKATLPKDLKIQGVSLRDGVCYVDFDSVFLTAPVDVADVVEIYSVVNSLTELPGVSQVQITINGSANEIFRNSIPLSGRFSQDLKFLEEEKEE